MAIWGVAGVFAALAAFGRHFPWWMPAAIGAVAIVWGTVIAIHLRGRFAFSDLVKTMEAETPADRGEPREPGPLHHHGVDGHARGVGGAEPSRVIFRTVNAVMAVLFFVSAALQSQRPGSRAVDIDLRRRGPARRVGGGAAACPWGAASRRRHRDRVVGVHRHAPSRPLRLAPPRRVDARGHAADRGEPREAWGSGSSRRGWWCWRSRGGDVAPPRTATLSAAARDGPTRRVTRATTRPRARGPWRPGTRTRPSRTRSRSIDPA